jgi:hypothetical protein
LIVPRGRAHDVISCIVPPGIFAEPGRPHRAADMAHFVSLLRSPAAAPDKVGAIPDRDAAGA